MGGQANPGGVSRESCAQQVVRLVSVAYSPSLYRRIMMPKTPVANPFTPDPRTATLDISNIRPAPADFRPTRAPGAGRPATPSPFEPILKDYVGADWQFYDHDGLVVMDGAKPTKESYAASNASTIVRELRKARKALNLGLRVQVDATTVAFLVTPEPSTGRPRKDS